MNHSKYKPEYCQKLIEHMGKGFSYETFGAEVGCGRTTLYDWEKQHPEWKEAKKQAMERAMKFFEQRLIVKISGVDIEGVDTKKIDTSCLIFALKTRFHQVYGERNKHDISTESGAINISFNKDAD